VIPLESPEHKNRNKQHQTEVDDGGEGGMAGGEAATSAAEYTRAVERRARARMPLEATAPS
jgi:hypothetical protein